MALDSEAKRWSMLQLAGGPSVYPLVFNPDTSGLSAIERATVLKLYGGNAFTGPAIEAAITGTVTTAVESDIVDGGKTVVITLTNGTWVTAGATFDAQRQNIIDGLDSDGSELTGWNAEVRDKEVVSSVVRTSDTVVTITLSAANDYAIDANETITVTVPASAISGASDVTGSPTFTITAQADATTEPRGSTRADQRHPAYDFGEHYPYLSREDKARIDDVIDALRPKQRESLRRGKPSNAVRKKIAQVIPEYETYTPRPSSEYLGEAEDSLDTLLTIILLAA